VIACAQETAYFHLMAVDFAKLDAPLAAKLTESEAGSMLSVFIRTHQPVSDTERVKLEQAGIGTVSRGAKVITATLSADAVRKLTQEPWVRAINLSQALRPVNLTRTLG